MTTLNWPIVFAEPNIRFDIHKLNCKVYLEENKYFLKEKNVSVSSRSS